MSQNDTLLGESVNTEYKVTLPKDSVKYMKSVIAFANSKGGKIIFGVDDKTRQIVGISNDDLFMMIDSISNAISDSCEPQLIPDIEPKTINGKNVIIVTVPASPNRPYYLKAKGMNDSSYIRVAGTSRPASADKIRELLREGSNTYWDELPCIGYFYNEESAAKLISAIAEARKKAGLPEKEITLQQLLNWRLLIKDNGKILPSNAFVLLTDAEFFPSSRLQCAVFKGTDRVIFLDKQEYDGPLYKQIEEGLSFVKRNIRMSAEIKGLYRSERYELPEAAVREMIVNAICHRDYLDSGCIQIALYDDRLEVTSPGGLYKDLTLEEALSGRSMIRNRAITNAFAQMGLIEAWGTGIKRIKDEAQEYNLPKPAFEASENMFRVNLYRSSSPMASENASEKHRNSIGTASVKNDVVLSAVQKEILASLNEEQRLSAAELSQIIGIAQRNIEANIRKLKDLGFLVRHGSPKNGYWEVRLVPKDQQ